MMSGPSSSPSLHQEPNISKKWKCIECDQVFIQSKLLETHAVDADHKAYRCTKEKACGKVFTLRPSWIRHERSHSAKKTHACSRCGKKFHRKDNCHDHERTCGRVARRARGPSQSASTSPTTTTSSETTASGTPVDLLTAVLNDGEPSHATETGCGGLKSFDTPEATIQRDNGHDDVKATPFVSGQLIDVPIQYLSASSTASFPTTNNGPTQSRAAAFHDAIESHPPEPEGDNLLTVDNTEIHTAFANTNPQPGAGNDWRHYYQSFQGPYDAPSPGLQHTDDDWNFPPEIRATSDLDNLRDNRPIYSDNFAASDHPQHMSLVSNIHNNGSNIHFSRANTFNALTSKSDSDPDYDSDSDSGISSRFARLDCEDQEEEYEMAQKRFERRSTSALASVSPSVPTVRVRVRTAIP